MACQALCEAVVMQRRMWSLSPRSSWLSEGNGPGSKRLQHREVHADAEGRAGYSERAEDGTSPSSGESGTLPGGGAV